MESTSINRLKDQQNQFIYHFHRNKTNLKPRIYIFSSFCMFFNFIYIFYQSDQKFGYFNVLTPLLLAITCLFFCIYTSFQVSQEYLLLISQLGLQTVSVYNIGTSSTKFVPWSSIRDVVVNEAVSGFRMVHYLAVLVTNSTNDTPKLILLLQNTKLRLPELKKIYQSIQEVLQH